MGWMMTGMASSPSVVVVHLRTARGQRVAVLSTLEPVVSVVVGWWAFEEIIGHRTVIGSVLVLLASILIALFDAKKKEMPN